MTFYPDEMTGGFARSYAEIVKFDKHDDGTMTVYGKATDDSLDIDMQICDAAWLDRAMPEWFKSGGNIREQHSNIAAGVAQEYERKDDGHYISALVVDPVSVKKVEARVLKGFSIGIKAPRVVRDQKAANGRIIDGQIVEVSLVDRPANPNAKLLLAKSTDTGMVQVEELVEKREVSTEERERLADEGNAMPDGSYPIANVSDLKNAIQAIGRAKDPAAVKRHIIRRARELDAIDQLPESWNVSKSIDTGFLVKFDKTEFDNARTALARLIEVEAGELAMGEDERMSLHHLLEAVQHLIAWYEGEALEGEAPPLLAENEEGEEAIELAADAEDGEEKMCKECGKSMKACKCSKDAAAEKSVESEEPAEEPVVESDEPADAPEQANEDSDAPVSDNIEEAVAKAVAAAMEPIRAEVATLLSAKEAAEQKAAGLESELAAAVTKAAGGGPKRTARTLTTTLNDNLIKAAQYEAKAAAATDPLLAKGYAEMASEYVKAANASRDNL